MPPAQAAAGRRPAKDTGMKMHSRSWHWDYVDKLERPRTAKERGIAMRRVPRPQSAPGGAWATLGSTRCVPGTLSGLNV